MQFFTNAQIKLVEEEALDVSRKTGEDINFVRKEMYKQLWTEMRKDKRQGYFILYDNRRQVYEVLRRNDGVEGEMPEVMMTLTPELLSEILTVVLKFRGVCA
jgi:hypothetical protein